MTIHEVYLETGEARTFAGALDWPGWCRSGKDAAGALQALVDYGPRYQIALQGLKVDFKPPGDVSELEVMEHLEGDSTTDFGAPGAWPEYDSRPLSNEEADRLLTILQACWCAFDEAVEAADGRELRKGPRGGGRELNAILEHVAGAELAYLRSVGRKPAQNPDLDGENRLSQIREAVEDAVRAGVSGELPTEGPRGGVRWTARYFVRRVAWHVLDHAWEIEDRV